MNSLDVISVINEYNIRDVFACLLQLGNVCESFAPAGRFRILLRLTLVEGTLKPT